VRAGMDRAAQALDTGAAARQLDAWVAATSAG
jgi:anthranilate phosphoribosyltransferase